MSHRPHFFFFNGQYVLAVLSSVVLVLLTSFLIHFVNQTNRKIAYFFDAIKNEGFTLRFPEKLSVESLEELNHSLNALNAMIQDIHIKKQAQEQYYQEIIRQADIGIMIINPKGHILFADPTVERLLDYTPLNHIDQLSQVDQKLHRLFKELRPFDRKLVQLTNERGKKQIALKSTSLALEKEALLLVVAQDIHHELEEKETDSWVCLIRVLTHEIMNIITPIISISESIRNYYTSGHGIQPGKKLSEAQIENTVKGLEVIKEQGGDLMEFVQSYRSFLSLPKPDKTLVMAQRLLEKVKVLMSQEHQGNHVTFEVFSNPSELEFFIDEKQISQVLINLSKNALQSIDGQESGMIRITAGTDGLGRKCIEVMDNGPGIPADVINEIFVPFFTTKKKGTGIGLSLSKQIMHLHGGSIHVKSHEHTVFILTFE